MLGLVDVLAKRGARSLAWISAECGIFFFFVFFYFSFFRAVGLFCPRIFHPCISFLVNEVLFFN